MKIIVLAGGLSPERDVSLSSGSLIANALIEKGHEVMFLDLLLDIKNQDIEYKNKDKNHKFSYKIQETEPDLEKLKQKYKNQIGEGIIELCKEADIVFLALHGGIGENGKLQAIFDVYNINYTGSSAIGSMLAMNKELSKILTKNENILTADWIINKNEIEKIGFPCVVKPNDGGSSIGVKIVNNNEELINALSFLKGDILIEKLIQGREFSVGIFNNKALLPIEIIPKEGFYDYKNKYQEGATIEICPAEISNELEKKLKETAEKIHKILKLNFYSRIDFIVDKDNNIYFLEANNLPGMTPTSLLPQEAKQEGISYEDLCEQIVLNK